MNVTNTDVNSPPTASTAGSTTTVAEGGTITLDGRQSKDPDGDSLTYRWEQQIDDAVACAPSTTCWVTVGNTAVVTLTAPQVPWPDGSTLTFGLTVSDGYLTNSARQLVSVTWVNAPPIAALTCPTSVDERSSVFLDGSGSRDDDGDGIAPNGYTWSQPSGGPTFPLPDSGDPTCPSCTASPSIDIAPVPSLVYGDTQNVKFTLQVTDNGGLSASADCFVFVNDITPPALSLPADVTAEATSSSGATVTYSASALDAFDGDVPINCSPASSATFPIGATTDGTTTVTCSAQDKSKNQATGSFTVTVKDTTPPMVTAPAAITTGPTAYNGAVVIYSGQKATDIVDGDVPVDCQPASGSLFTFGSNTVTCTAADKHGNKGTGTFTITVTGFTNIGFFQPVANTPNVNTVKNGSTVPVKWRLQGKDGIQITDTRAVTSLNYQAINCTSLLTTSDAITIDTAATGATTLRYDFTAMQYIFNWQTPRAPGCYLMTVSFIDGSSESANFKLK